MLSVVNADKNLSDMDLVHISAPNEEVRGLDSLRHTNIFIETVQMLSKVGTLQFITPFLPSLFGNYALLSFHTLIGSAIPDISFPGLWFKGLLQECI